MLPQSFALRFLILSFLNLLLFQLTVKSSAACSPIPPDWWFTELFTVETKRLPPGITIKSSVLSDRMFGDRGYLEITNDSASPLYLLAPEQPGTSVMAELPVPLPEGMALKHQLTPGQAVVFNIGQVASMVLPGLENHNQQADGRPANVELPLPQQARLDLVYGDHLISVPVTLTYILNPNYDPKQSENSAQACGQAYVITSLFVIPFLLLMYVIPWCVGLGLLVSVGVGGWLGWRRWRGRGP